VTEREVTVSQHERPWNDEHPRGADDFWQALEGHLAIAGASAFGSPADAGAWLAALRAGREGDWGRYGALLRQSGVAGADSGLSLSAVTATVRALPRRLLPLFVERYASEPARLIDALALLDEFAGHGQLTIANAYVARRQAEVHARETDLATTLDSIGDAVVVTDAQGRVLRMNPVAERLTGVTLAEARGQPLETIFQIENETTRATVESPVPRVLREGVVVGLANHTVLVARDGARRPIADSGAPVRDEAGQIRGVVLVFRDVTEERRAEEALRHWERIFQHATWGVALADIRSVRFQAVNPAYARMHGYTVAELVGQPVSTLWTENTRADMERHARETKEHGQLVAETTHLRKDGTTVPVEIVATTIKDVTGETAWFVANVQDITERKRLEHSRARAIELEARNRRIEEANRLKSEFLASMSHELRTPLNSVIGFTELLHDEQVGDISPKQKEFLGDILAAGRHLLRLINDVLDLAKVEAGKMEFRPEPVELARLVGTVVQSLRTPALEKRIEVTTAVDPQLTNVVLDPGRFKQVLYNYLSNALKFTPDEGRVVVRAMPEGDDWFRLEVEDNGCGVPHDDLPRLFVAFQQLESGSAKRHGGTGLGLALTRRLAEAQGGTVGVEPAPGGGSIFYAVLPQRHAGHTVALGRSAAMSSVGRLLLLASAPSAREGWSESLMDAGYEVDPYASASQAERALKESVYDAVVVDVQDAGSLRAFVETARHGSHGESIPVVGIGDYPGLSLVEAVPRAKATLPALLAALARSGAPPPRGRPVLVVDDDASSLRLMEATLHNLGYEAVCCTSPHEALGVLQRLRPAALVIDIIMPDMDGLAFLARFRATEGTRKIPVMFWTVKDLSAQERAELQSSVDLVIQKGVGVGSRLSAALQGFLPPSARKEA
jgi:PAS domain S-box-containing protein